MFSKLEPNHPKVHLKHRFLEFFEHILDVLYTSRFNPIQQSGSFATALLGFIVLSGLYLVFFYRIGAPYESVIKIHEQFLGQWIRSAHRYATDLALVAIGVHVLKMFLERKSWGPRTLAWLSGIVLFGMFLLSVWTGFVLVWDRQGQLLAIGGAKLGDSIGILSEPLSRSFSGAIQLGSSFFFMNLFLHVAIPLGITFLLWLHTSRLSRARWKPSKPVIKLWGLAILLSSLIWPCLEPQPSDLKLIQSPTLTDLWFNFWLWTEHPGSIVIIAIVLLIILIIAPLWTRPKERDRPLTSVHNEEKCEGCSQCYYDCPFDAIQMIPRRLSPQPQGTLARKLSSLVAQVQPELCVSCGICSGSCSEFAIGPPNRSGIDQLKAMQSLRNPKELKSEKGILVYCEYQSAVSQEVFKLTEQNPKWIPYPVECVGSVHPGALSNLASRFLGVFIATCPEHVCRNREGSALLTRRLFEKQSPGIPPKMEKRRFFIWSGSKGKTKFLKGALDRFNEGLLGQDFNSIARLQALQDQENAHTTPMKTGIAFLLALLFLYGVISVSNQMIPSTQDSSFLRLTFRLPGQVRSQCHEQSLKELELLPAHMRVTTVCEKRPVPYQLIVLVDGKEHSSKIVSPKGAQHDRPINIDEMTRVTSGQHAIEIRFVPSEESAPEKKPLGTNQLNAISLLYREVLGFSNGRATLISFNPEKQVLEEVKD